MKQMILGNTEIEKKLDKIAMADLRKGVEKAILLVQGYAKANCDVFSQPTGELRNSIFVSVEGDERTVVGICYTNKEYAMYVEFGTGPVGQANHIGISPEVPVAYRQSGWMIPGHAMTREKAENYGFGVAEDKEGNPIGYFTNGQPARPFLYPALKNHEDEILEIISADLRRQL